MESNVLSWGAALEKGRVPGLYPYVAEDVPLGTYEAVLDFQIWAKKAMAICCYFTKMDTGTKLQLKLYRRQKDELYKLNYGAIDFKTCPVNEVYTLTVILNGKQKVVLKEAAKTE